jgi:hypothetical protein
MSLRIKVALSNTGGVLDYRMIKSHDITKDENAITKAVLEMIRGAAFLLPGDTITIREID